MNENEAAELMEKKKAELLPVDPEERLDWEFYQPPPPPKRKGKIQVQLVYKGRAKPMPVPDPDEE